MVQRLWQEDDGPEKWKPFHFVAIPKKGDLTDCADYKTVALITRFTKILLTMLKRLPYILVYKPTIFS